MVPYRELLVNCLSGVYGYGEYPVSFREPFRECGLRGERDRRRGPDNRRAPPSRSTAVTSAAPAEPGTSDELRREVAKLRERIERLCKTSLKICSQLDLDAILQEIVDGARMLTGARYATIHRVGEAGLSPRFLSSGLSEEERRALFNWPDGPTYFEHIRDLEVPVRVPDLWSLVRSLGLSPIPLPQVAVHGLPLKYRAEHLGNFYLFSGNEKTLNDEDEHLLLLFGAQAAAAIANANRYRHELATRRALETLIETTPVGVAMFDPKTAKPTSLNREARRITRPLRTPGSQREELLENLTLRRGDGREFGVDQLPLTEAFSDDERVRAEEIQLSTPGKRSVKVLVNATPVHDTAGTITSLIVAMQDLAPLEEIDRMRAKFLGMVSHELRTPLAAIKGSTAAVLNRARPFGQAETREFFRIVDEQADRMIGLIADLLDAGRIDAGALSISPEPTDMALLFDQARNTFVASGGRHTLLIDLPPDLPGVLADRDRAGQVLNNLLTNAARHSPPSSPIRIGAGREGGHVAVTVVDEGRGIAPERLKNLFSRFGGRREEGKGLTGRPGLGLSICKGLVEAHGGRIRAASDGLGRGARFTFTLPAAGDAIGAVPVQTEEPPPEGEPQRILAVDDDPQTLRHVREVLTEAGYAPVVTGDHDALGRIVQVEQPALVLLDLMLPGTDGIELMRTVPELAGLPVIFISGYGRDETMSRALEAGAADYIVKPFSPTELVARIKAVLRRRAGSAPFVLGDLAIDYDLRRVTLAGSPVELTPTEYELLYTLSRNAGRVTTYQALLKQVWSERKSHDTKVVRAFVKQLRNKLGDDAADPSWLFNVRGVGYRMPRPDETASPEARRGNGR